MKNLIAPSLSTYQILTLATKRESNRIYRSPNSPTDLLARASVPMPKKVLRIQRQPLPTVAVYTEDYVVAAAKIIVEKAPDQLKTLTLFITGCLLWLLEDSGNGVSNGGNIVNAAKQHFLSACKITIDIGAACGKFAWPLILRAAPHILRAIK